MVASLRYAVYAIIFQTSHFFFVLYLPSFIIYFITFFSNKILFQDGCVFMIAR